jgi:hypothetical protein
MTALSQEMANNMAVFTSDHMAKTVKEAGPRSLIQSGAIETLKKLMADAKTEQNAHTAVASLATTCTAIAEVCHRPFILHDWSKWSEYSVLMLNRRAGERITQGSDCAPMLQPLIVPMTELLKDCAHKKAEICTTAEGVSCPFVLRDVTTRKQCACQHVISCRVGCNENGCSGEKRFSVMWSPTS